MNCLSAWQWQAAWPAGTRAGSQPLCLMFQVLVPAMPHAVLEEGRKKNLGSNVVVSQTF